MAAIFMQMRFLSAMEQKCDSRKHSGNIQYRITKLQYATRFIRFMLIRMLWQEGPEHTTMIQRPGVMSSICHAPQRMILYRSFPKKTPDIIYLCFPNNPTGTTITKAQLQEWVDYANKIGAVIIYDAAYEAYISEDDVAHSIYECEGARTCAIELAKFFKKCRIYRSTTWIYCSSKRLKSRRCYFTFLMGKTPWNKVQRCTIHHSASQEKPATVQQEKHS